ncbi:hypothetical protein DFS33DRAFT_428814 [Desarmillaria ectypa]|nr:hypothetical protein DFS33DRAFT_428814 [Desarmillaria ectypa]
MICRTDPTLVHVDILDHPARTASLHLRRLPCQSPACRRQSPAVQCPFHSPCKQIASEAAYYRAYVSLDHEQQIMAFISNIPETHSSQILSADVANDGRIVSYSDQTVPVSCLYQALGTMSSLRRLRVFDCRRGGPTRDFIPGARLSLQFELAMFPSGRSALHSYELYLQPSTQAVVFQTISPTNIRALRLSGRVRFNRYSLFHTCRYEVLQAIIWITAWRSNLIIQTCKVFVMPKATTE